MDLWAYQNRVQIDFSRPGKPTDNARVESFNGTLRAECLDVHWFATLTEAKQVIESRRRENNESRPHRSLGERTPSELPKTHLESYRKRGPIRVGGTLILGGPTLVQIAFRQPTWTASVGSRAVNRRFPELWKARRIRSPALGTRGLSEAAAGHNLDSIRRHHMETCFSLARPASIESVT